LFVLVSILLNFVSVKLRLIDGRTNGQTPGIIECGAF